MLNDKQELFFKATLRGEKPEQAAISAGLSAKTAKAAGFRMRKHPAIVAALAAVGIKTQGAPVVTNTTTHDASAADSQLLDELPKTDDSCVFLVALMNDPKAGIKARLEAAKALLPFQHAKIGEKGKKATKVDAATDHAAEGNRFGARKPPALKAVN